MGTYMNTPPTLLKLTWDYFGGLPFLGLYLLTIYAKVGLENQLQTVGRLTSYAALKYENLQFTKRAISTTSSERSRLSCAVTAS